MTPGTTYPAFGQLCKHARERGFEIGLTVSDQLHGEKGKEYRALDRLVIRRADQPKSSPVSSTPVTFTTLEQVSADLLGRVR